MTGLTRHYVCINEGGDITYAEFIDFEHACREVHGGLVNAFTMESTLVQHRSILKYNGYIFEVVMNTNGVGLQLTASPYINGLLKRWDFPNIYAISSRSVRGPVLITGPYHTSVGREFLGWVSNELEEVRAQDGTS